MSAPTDGNPPTLTGQNEENRPRMDGLYIIKVHTEQTSGSRRWRFSVGLPKFFIRENLESDLTQGDNVPVACVTSPSVTKWLSRLKEYSLILWSK